MADQHDFPTPLSDERRQRILERGRARVRRNHRITAAVVGACVVALATPIALAANSRHESLNTVDSGPTTTLAVPSTSTSSTSSTTSTTTTVSPSATTVAAPSTAVQNLPADAAVKADLRAAYLTYKEMASYEIEAGTNPGSVYYAFAPETQTYWAVAAFTTTTSIDPAHVLSMADGGNTGLFTKPDGGVWHMVGVVGPPCPPPAPPDVLDIWGYTANETAAMHQTCDGQVLPVGGSLDLVIGADYYLYPKAWTVDPLHNAGGSSSIASASDPHSGARIDYVLNGGTSGFYLANHAPNYDGAAAKGLPGCALSSWTAGGIGARRFTCKATADGLEVSGVVVIRPWHQGAAMLRVTMAPTDRDVAQVILSRFVG